MGNKAVLGLIVVAAIVGIFFLVGGTDLFTDAGDVGDGGASDGVGLEGADAPDGAGAADAEGTGKGPMLFGRARADRKGVGGLQGRVMDFKSGEPVGETRITLVGVGYDEEDVALKTRGDASGYFSFPEVPAGDGYVLKVSDGRGRARMLPSQSVDHGAVTEVATVWLGKQGTLRGIVEDVEGRPIAGASVQVHPGGGSALELLTNMPKLLEQLDKDAEPIAQTETTARGRFDIPAMAPGPMTLVVRAKGHRQEIRSIVMAEEGAAGGVVRITLQGADAITGIVVDQDDRPVEGARVACLEQSKMESIFFGRQFSETGPDGRFEVPSPPTTGEIAVIVAAAGYPTLFTQTSGGGEQRFVLFRGTEVLVRVVRSGDGRPVEGAQLMAMISGKENVIQEEGMTFAAAPTDARGEATILARPGHLQMLFLTHPDHGTATYSPMMSRMGGPAAAGAMLKGPKEATIGTKKVTFEFELGTGITVTGRVTDENGDPIAGARVATLGTMGMGASTRTDADGRYELRNQGPPVRMVLVTKPGYVQKQGDPMRMMAAMRTEDFEQDVTLLEAASVSGRVLRADGKPAVGARVRAGSEGGMGMLTAMLGGAGETVTNEQGRYVLDGVHPDKKVYVMARHIGWLDAKSDAFEVKAAGATKAPDLVLARGVALEVKVLAPDGRAARAADVEVDLAMKKKVEFDPMSGWGNWAEARTRSDGTAGFRDVPEGKATITARLGEYAPGRATVDVPDRSAASGNVEVTVQLREGVKITGRVVDRDGNGIAEADVMLRGAGEDDPETWVPPDSTVTEEDGSFTLVGVPGTRVTLSISADGFKAGEEVFTPGLGALVIELDRQDADAARRLEAIEKELQELYMQIGSAKDDASRQALARRLQALNAEKRKLEGE